MTNLYEDEKGLYYEAKIGTHTAGQDFLKMVESELINQHSFGFRTIKEQYDSSLKANKIKEVFLYEGSAVQFLGANPETNQIGLKDYEDQFAKLEKFIKTTDCTDETIIELENKLKSLHALLKPGKPTPDSIEADYDHVKNILKTWK